MSRTPICHINHENVRPDDYNTHDYNSGDCTTRALAYVLKGIMSYNEIEEKQYSLAKVRGTRRNTTGTWDLVLREFGYSWIQIKSGNYTQRGKLANLLAFQKEPILAVSRTHVAALHNGEIIDTWDSSRGKIFCLLVSNFEIDAIVSTLNVHGIECYKADGTPVYNRQNKRRRWYW